MTTPNETKPAVPSSTELSGGAQAGIGVGIGVGNVCCGPTCYGCPTFVSSLIGLILYFTWKKDKPKTAKNILIVTLVTGGVSIMLITLAFALGIASSVINELNY